MGAISVLEPEVHSHEGVGLMAWCPVSWPSPWVGGRARALGMASRLRVAAHVYTSLTASTASPSRTPGALPISTLSLLFSPEGVLLCFVPLSLHPHASAGTTASESVDVELGASLPEAPRPCLALASRLCVRAQRLLSGHISVSKWALLPAALGQIQCISWNWSE